MPFSKAVKGADCASANGARQAAPGDVVARRRVCPGRPTEPAEARPVSAKDPETLRFISSELPRLEAQAKGVRSDL
jgi:hypothetical protein